MNCVSPAPRIMIISRHPNGLARGAKIDAQTCSTLGKLMFVYSLASGILANFNPNTEHVYKRFIFTP